MFLEGETRVSTGPLDNSKVINSRFVFRRRKCALLRNSEVMKGKIDLLVRSKPLLWLVNRLGKMCQIVYGQQGATRCQMAPG